MTDIDLIHADLDEHRHLVNVLKEKKLVDAWLNFQSSRNDGVVRIPEEDLLSVEKKCTISFPSQIKYFYSQIGSVPSDFHYQINRIVKHENQQMLDYQYTETLASNIVKTYFELEEKTREKVSSQIIAVDTKNFRRDYETDLNFLLWEGVNFYSRSGNFFDLPFLQQVFENLGRSKDLIIETFLTWTHCGGSGGIVLNTKAYGYNGGLMFGSGLSVNYNDTSFTYYSDYYKESQKYHLIDYTDDIDSALFELRVFMKTHRISSV